MMLANGYYYEEGSAARVSAVFSVNDLGRYALELENATVQNKRGQGYFKTPKLALLLIPFTSLSICFFASRFFFCAA